jgi:hypothetical protein
VTLRHMLKWRPFEHRTSLARAGGSPEQLFIQRLNHAPCAVPLLRWRGCAASFMLHQISDSVLVALGSTYQPSDIHSTTWRRFPMASAAMKQLNYFATFFDSGVETPKHLWTSPNCKKKCKYPNQCFESVLLTGGANHPIVKFMRIFLLKLISPTPLRSFGFWPSHKSSLTISRRNLGFGVP